MIAVISVLAGLLLTALEDAIESSRKISCLSQLKQWYLVISLYADDSAEWMPGSTVWGINEVFSSEALPTRRHGASP